MKYTLSYIETLLGRSINNTERMLYDRFKNSETYKFVKDGNGNLRAEKI